MKHIGMAQIKKKGKVNCCFQTAGGGLQNYHTLFHFADLQPIKLRDGILIYINSVHKYTFKRKAL